MTTIRYSPATGGFYDKRIHTAIPDDAVTVTAATHARLMRAQARGMAIVARDGKPRLARPADRPVATQREDALAAIDGAARARILRIASLAQQSNDNAALAIAALTGALSDEAAAALDRRTRIEAVRIAARIIRAHLADADAATLAAFDAADSSYWPGE